MHKPILRQPDFSKPQPPILERPIGCTQRICNQWERIVSCKGRIWNWIGVHPDLDWEVNEAKLGCCGVVTSAAVLTSLWYLTFKMYEHHPVPAGILFVTSPCVACYLVFLGPVIGKWGQLNQAQIAKKNDMNIV
jgi:hypothetical protein